MDISTISQEVSESVSTNFSTEDTTVLTMAESAKIMRIMLSSIDLEKLTTDYFALLREKIPCKSLKLAFAEQVLQAGKASARAGNLKIVIYYGLEAPQFFISIVHNSRDDFS